VIDKEGVGCWVGWLLFGCPSPPILRGSAQQPPKASFFFIFFLNYYLLGEISQNLYEFSLVLTLFLSLKTLN
jgi:hypothetical protein